MERPRVLPRVPLVADPAVLRARDAHRSARTGQGLTVATILGLIRDFQGMFSFGGGASLSVRIASPREREALASRVRRFYARRPRPWRPACFRTRVAKPTRFERRRTAKRHYAAILRREQQAPAVVSA